MTVKNALGALALEETQLSQEELLEWLVEMVQHVRVLSAVRETNGSLRITVTNTPAVTVSSGTITTVATVTTLATLTNQAQLGSQPAQQIVPATQNLIAHLGNVAQIAVS